MEDLKPRSDWDAKLKAMAEAARENRKRLQAWTAAHTEPEPEGIRRIAPLGPRGPLPVTQAKR